MNNIINPLTNRLPAWRPLPTVIILMLINFKTQAQMPKWYANGHFKITHDEEQVNVHMRKMPWESFSVTLPTIYENDGLLTFEVHAEKPLTLRVDALLANGRQTELLIQSVTPGDFQRIVYALTAIERGITHLLFYVNPGQVFHGEVNIKGLGIQAYEKTAERISVFPNPATAQNVLVQLPDITFTHLSLYDVQGNVVLSKQPNGSPYIILNLAGVKPGLYVLKAWRNDTLFTTKVVLR